MPNHAGTAAMPAVRAQQMRCWPIVSRWPWPLTWPLLVNCAGAIPQTSKDRPAHSCSVWAVLARQLAGVGVGSANDNCAQVDGMVRLLSDRI